MLPQDAFSVVRKSFDARKVCSTRELYVQLKERSWIIITVVNFKRFLPYSLYSSILIEFNEYIERTISLVENQLYGHGSSDFTYIYI